MKHCGLFSQPGRASCRLMKKVGQLGKRPCRLFHAFARVGEVPVSGATKQKAFLTEVRVLGGR